MVGTPGLGNRLLNIIHLTCLLHLFLNWQKVCSILSGFLAAPSPNNWGKNGKRQPHMTLTSTRVLLIPLYEFPDDFLILSLLSVFCYLLTVHTPVLCHQLFNASVPISNGCSSLAMDTKDLNKREMLIKWVRKSP